MQTYLLALHELEALLAANTVVGCSPVVNHNTVLGTRQRAVNVIDYRL